MGKLRVLDLFSGIGGFSLGLERTGGFETVAFCEIEPFPRRVLAKHWPEVPCYDDVRTLTAARLASDGIAVDVICGGFPCQDISVAGKRAGIAEGTRSGLWSEIDRLIGELRPAYVIVENVANLLRGPVEQPGGWFGRVLGDLAERGYSAEWENIPASAMGAPHRRERVWLVAYPNGERQHECGAVSDGSPQRKADHHFIERQNRNFAASHLGEALADADDMHEQGIVASFAHSQGWAGPLSGSLGPCGNGFGGWAVEPDVGRVANGVPDRAHRLKALGNAVVPQIPELIGNAILASLTAPVAVAKAGDVAQTAPPPIHTERV